MKLLIMQCSLAHCYFLSLKHKNSCSQTPSVCILPSGWETTGFGCFNLRVFTEETARRRYWS